MSERRQINLPPEDQRERFGVIEKREDLFETKLLRITPEKVVSQSAKNILIASRDPGSGNGLLPVMKRLDRGDNISMVALTDGRAQEIFQKEFETEDSTPQDSVLRSTEIMGNPDLVLTDASSNRGIEGHALLALENTPSVLLEDYYFSSLVFLKQLKDSNARMPESICVMDEEAKSIILENFPELESRIVVTGQPAFDKISNENTAEISDQIRSQLGLREGDKVVSFMAQLPSLEEIQAIAQEMANIGENFYMAFRRHPRDTNTYEDYERTFKGCGITFLDTRKFTTDQISAASDVILTEWSTEGLSGIYRRKPTIHLLDKSITEIPSTVRIPLPPVKLGASVGVYDVNNLPLAIRSLLDPQSEVRSVLKQNMEKYYPSDGKNAERVEEVILRVLDKQELTKP